MTCVYVQLTWGTNHDIPCPINTNTTEMIAGLAEMVKRRLVLYTPRATHSDHSLQIETE